ncbi:hypothetical protein A5876_002498, partial [Enterococcus sp. 3C8_DIV0646]
AKKFVIYIFGDIFLSNSRGCG